MPENKVVEEREESATSASLPAEEIRVTDRRRINLDQIADEENNLLREEEGVGDEAPSLKPTYVEELEARTRAAEQKVLDVQSRFEQLRREMQLETDATRQRLTRAAEERARNEKAGFIATLLPVADNLQRAIEAIEKGGSRESVLDGLRSTMSSFENALNAAGVEPINSVGASFDPELHEAVETREVEPELDNTVMAEYNRGYKIGDRLLRPARVQVGRARKSNEAKRAAE